MGILSFTQTRLASKEVARGMDDTAAAMQQLQQVPFLTGVFLEGVVLAGGANVINHRLGYTPKGYIVTKSSGSLVHSYPRMTAATTATMTLNVSAAATLDLWVF